MSRRARRNHTPACSSSACGAASSTSRSICEPTTVSARPVLRSAVTWASITAGVHTRALTAPHPISLLHAAASPLGSLTTADAPLIDAENLVRQAGPPLLIKLIRMASPEGASR
jgi:hypothetical protein